MWIGFGGIQCIVPGDVPARAGELELLLLNMDNTEGVSIRVGQHDIICAGFILPSHLDCAKV